jgi:predicted transcriptional regulator
MYCGLVLRTGNGPIVIGPREFRVIHKIVEDTLESRQYSIVRSISQEPKTIVEIASVTNISVTDVRRFIEDMEILGIIRRELIQTPHGKGRSRGYYLVSEEIRNLLHSCGF